MRRKPKGMSGHEARTSEQIGEVNTAVKDENYILVATMSSYVILALFVLVINGSWAVYHYQFENLPTQLDLESAGKRGIFKVKTCGFPPLEDREKSVAMFSRIDFFGAGSLVKEEITRLAELEKEAVNDMFIILSDVWLDNEDTMENLKTIFNGYENEHVVLSVLVFLGNFFSRPCNLSFNSYSSLRSQFGKPGKKVSLSWLIDLALERLNYLPSDNNRRRGSKLT